MKIGQLGGHYEFHLIDPRSLGEAEISHFFSLFVFFSHIIFAAFTYSRASSRCWDRVIVDGCVFVIFSRLFFLCFVFHPPRRHELKSFEFRVFLALIHKQFRRISQPSNIQLDFNFNNVWASHTSPSNNYERFAGLFSLSVKASALLICVNFEFWFHSYLPGIFFFIQEIILFYAVVTASLRDRWLPSLAKSLYEHMKKISHISVGPREARHNQRRKSHLNCRLVCFDEQTKKTLFAGQMVPTSNTIFTFQ